MPLLRRLSQPFAQASFLSGFLLIFAVLTLTLLHDRESRAAFSDVFTVFIDLLACGALIAATRKTWGHSHQLGTAWGVIALAFLFYTLGDISWLVLEVSLKQQPLPTIADWFYIAFYPAILVGAFLMLERRSGLKWTNDVLDISIAILASFLGYWNFLIAPTREAYRGLSVSDQGLLLSYLVGALVLFIALLVMIYQHSSSQDERARYLLAGSLLVAIVSDLAFTQQSLTGTYGGGGLVDFGWIVSSLLAGLAGVSEWASLRPQAPARKRGPVEEHLQLRSINPFLPYIWLLFALFLLIYEGFYPLPMSRTTLSFCIAGLVILAIIRQVFSLVENNRLNQGLKLANQQLETEVAERRRVEVQLSYESMHDALTGLANRVLFLDRLGQALEYAKRSQDYKFAVLFIDLDKFKVINDSLGHLFGDLLLAEIASRLGGCLRSSDTVARFGGDEFEVLLDVTSGEDSVLAVAEKIRNILQPSFRILGREIFMTASIGVIKNLDGYERAEEILRDADIAMYQAKDLGGDRAEVFSLDMRQKAYARLELENELRSGLEKQEFALVYQPILLLGSEQLVGFEALLRWNHPRRGLLLPEEFLATAEESGLILPLGEWILHTACAQMKAWQEKYPALQRTSISVNIASRQLAQPDFYESVRRALEASCLSPDDLKLEITENVLISNYAAASETFRKLKDLGVELQLDDFGTGYSALGYLQYFPIDSIKIDRSFISTLDEDHRGNKLVRALVSMARELGVATIAEGIETQKQLDELLSLACSYGQGYLLSMPLDPGAVDAYLDHQAAARH